MIVFSIPTQKRKSYLRPVVQKYYFKKNISLQKYVMLFYHRLICFFFEVYLGVFLHVISTERLKYRIGSAVCNTKIIMTIHVYHLSISTRIGIGFTEVDLLIPGYCQGGCRYTTSVFGPI